MWTSPHGEYAPLPQNPGWAIYRGCTVREGDRFEPFGAGYGRPVQIRFLDMPSFNAVDLSSVLPHKRNFVPAAAGVFGGESPLRSISRASTVFWRRRPDNPFDTNAIEIYIENLMVGHVPARIALTQAPLLDAMGSALFRSGAVEVDAPARWDDLGLSRPSPRALVAFERECSR